MMLLKTFELQVGRSIGWTWFLWSGQGVEFSEKKRTSDFRVQDVGLIWNQKLLPVWTWNWTVNLKALELNSEFEGVLWVLLWTDVHEVNCNCWMKQDAVFCKVGLESLVKYEIWNLNQNLQVEATKISLLKIFRLNSFFGRSASWLN